MSNFHGNTHATGSFGLQGGFPRALLGRYVGAALVLGALVWFVGAQLAFATLRESSPESPLCTEPALVVLETPLFAPWQLNRCLGALSHDTTQQALRARAELTMTLVWFAVVIALVTCAKWAWLRITDRSHHVHGSDRWAAREDLEQAGLLEEGDGLILGMWPDQQAGRLRLLRHAGPEHVALVAPTGGGKGVTSSVPNALTWKESMIVLDIKGDLFRDTAGYRKSLGHNVFKLNYAADPGKSARFNLLSFVRLGTAHEVTDVRGIATALIDPQGKLLQGGSDQLHWLSTGIGLLTAACLHVLYRRHDAKRPHERACLPDVLAELSRPGSFQKTLEEWRTYRHDPTLKCGWVTLDENKDRSATHPIVAAAAQINLKREEKERAGILSTTASSLDPFLAPNLAYNSMASDFAVDDIMDGAVPTTLYVQLAIRDIPTLGGLFRIFMDLLIRRLCEDGREDQEDPDEAAEQDTSASTSEPRSNVPRPPHQHQLLLLLDEFTAPGKIPIIQEAIAYVRSSRIRILLVFQNMNQLFGTYGREEAITGNVGIVVAYTPSPADQETAKLLSAMTGSETVSLSAVTKSLALGNAFGQGNSQSEQLVARPLLTPAEVSRMPVPRKIRDRIVKGGKMLAFAAGVPAIQAKQFLYFKDPVLAKRKGMQVPPPCWRPAPEHSPRLTPTLVGGGAAPRLLSEIRAGDVIVPAVSSKRVDE